MLATDPSQLPVGNALQVLFVGRNLDFTLTTDQALTKLFSGAKYRVTDIIATRKTGAGATACAGGIYDTASKGGNALVAAAQSWVTLAAGVNVAPTIAAVNNTAVLAPSLFLSLTTGSSAALTGDIFVVGYCYD